MRRNLLLRRVLLGSGVVSSVLYVAIDVLAARRFPGYRYSDYSISEEIAIKAPTRRLWVWLGSLYNALVAALAVGVWASAGGATRLRRAVHTQRAMRVTGAALAGYAAASTAGLFLAPLLAPRGTSAPKPEEARQMTRRASRHILATAAINLLFLLSMGFGSTLLSQRFRSYTYATMATLFGFGALASLYIRRLAANRPTPGLGIVERVTVYASLLWLAVLGVALGRAQATALSK